MRAVLALVIYATVVAWCLPAPLARLTAGGISPRLGIAAWLAATASVLASLGAALALLVRTVAAGWPQFSQAVCRAVAGNACAPSVYRSALYELGLAALLAVVSLAALAAAWRYGRRVQRARHQTAGHASAARIVGRALPGALDPAADRGRRPAGPRHRSPSAVVLDDPRPAAYCAAGRPPVIVVTRGALDMLDGAQLPAVLAHEQAHLSGRHYALMLAVRSLSAAFPGVPLFATGAAVVALLAEMRADDAAARFAGRSALITALIAIATGNPEVPGTALAVASYAVPARVERMLRAPVLSRRAAFAAALLTVTVLLFTAPPLLALLTS